MKKLMIAFAVAAMAAASQAAAFSWKTSDNIYTITAANVGDNGNYDVGTTYAKNNTTLTMTLQIYSAGTLVGEQSATMKYSTGGYKANVNIEVAAAQASTAYDYVVTLTGTDTALTGRGKETTYDYTNAQITQTYSGSITTETMGKTTITDTAKTSWAVSGITKEEPGPGPEPVPEPTSAMLMLLGVAGLALKRKRA